MAAKNNVLAIPLSTVSVSGSYQAFTALPQACFEIRITNASNNQVTISLDGTNDHDVVLQSQVLAVEAQTNSQPNNFRSNFAKNLTLYVKGSGAGNVYLAGYYQPQESNPF